MKEIEIDDVGNEDTYMRSVAQFSKFRRFARRFPAGCGGFRKLPWNGQTMYTKCSAKFAVRLKRSGKSSWRSVKIADILWYVLGNVVVKDLNMYAGS